MTHALHVSSCCWIFAFGHGMFTLTFALRVMKSTLGMACHPSVHRQQPHNRHRHLLHQRRGNRSLSLLRFSPTQQCSALRCFSPQRCKTQQLDPTCTLTPCRSLSVCRFASLRLKTTRLIRRTARILRFTRWMSCCGFDQVSESALPTSIFLA